MRSLRHDDDLLRSRRRPRALAGAPSRSSATATRAARGRSTCATAAARRSCACAATRRASRPRPTASRPHDVEAANDADVICILVPDDVDRARCRSRRRADSCVIVASGYTLGFGRLDPPGDSGMVAPRMLGPEVRRCYEEGVGFITAVGVHHDATGRALRARARDRARRSAACARARSSSRRCRKRCSTSVSSRCSRPRSTAVNNAFVQTMIEHGIPIEAIIIELVLSGEVERTYRLLREVGYAVQSEFHSPTSQYGQLTRRGRYDHLDFAATMRELADDIESGRFADEWDAERDAGYPHAHASEGAARGPGRPRVRSRAAPPARPERRTGRVAHACEGDTHGSGSDRDRRRRQHRDAQRARLSRARAAATSSRCATRAPTCSSGGRASGASTARYTDLDDAARRRRRSTRSRSSSPTPLHAEHVIAALRGGQARVVPEADREHGRRTARRMVRGRARRGRDLPGHRAVLPLPAAAQGARPHRVGRRSATPTVVRIKTVVGRTESEFQAEPRSRRATRGASTTESPGGHLFDDVMHKYAMALWLVDERHPQRAGDRAPGPAVLRGADRRAVGVRPRRPARDDGGVVRARHVHPQRLLRRRRVLRDPGHARLHLGDAPVRQPARRPRAGRALRGGRPPDVVRGARRVVRRLVPPRRGRVRRRRCSRARRPTSTPRWRSRRCSSCFAVYQASNERRPVEPDSIDGAVSPNGWPPNGEEAARDVEEMMAREQARAERLGS